MNLTQKISQMTPKGADLAATDLIEVSTLEAGSYVTKSITGQELIDAIPAPTGFVPETRTLTINGVAQDLSADRSWTISTGLTVGTTPISSGTNGRVLFQGTGNVLQQSSNLFWDNVNQRAGLGTSTPLARLHVFGGTTDTLKIETGTTSLYNQFISTDGIGEFGIFQDAFYFQPLTTLANGLRFYNGANAVSLQMSQTGNIQIGTTTDAGFRLDVNGTARVSGLVTATLSNYNSTHSGNTTRGFYIVNSSDSVVRGGIEYDGTNAFVQLAGRYNNGAAFFRQDGSNGNISFLRSGFEYGRIFGATGNWGINTTTDAGFRLDVNGTARFSDKIFFGRANFSSNDTDGQLRLVANAVVYNSAGAASTSTTSSCFEITSTTKGFLPPRMTTTQRNAIASPAAGLIVYDTTLNLPHFFNGTIWVSL